MQREQRLSNQDYQREEQAEKVLQFLDSIEADKVFKDDKSKLEFLKNITVDEFLNLLVKVNNILRGKEFRGNMPDGDAVMLTGGIDSEVNFPKQEEKLILFKEMFDCIRQMTDLKEISTLITGTITGTHLFKDANGRSSRLFYYLMSENYSAGDEQRKDISDLLGGEGRYKVDIHPGLIDREIGKVIQSEEGFNADEHVVPVSLNFGDSDYDFGDDVSNEDKHTIERIFDSHSDRWAAYAVYSFLYNKGILEDYLLKFYDEKTGEIKRTRIDKVKLSRDIAPEDIKEITDRYNKLNINRIRKFIDIVASEPKKYPMPDGSPGTIKEKFFERIKVDYNAD